MFETGQMTANHTVFMKRNAYILTCTIYNYARHTIDHGLGQMRQIIIFHP